MASLARGAVARFALLPVLLAACVVTALLPVIIPSAASTTDYYVDLNAGSDSNSGSATRPWRTIQKAADTLEAGETVHVRAGDYGERVWISRSGVSGAPITYRAEAKVIMRGFTVRADYVAIQGFEITDTPDEWDNGPGIFVQGSHCAIENNHVYDATRGGILVFGERGTDAGPHGCVVRNNRLQHNALMGIEINGSDHVVEGNDIWGTIQYHPKWANAPSWADADGIRFFGSGHRIQRNYIHDITFDDPANVNPHIDCFQTWGPAADIVLEQNVCDVLEYQAPHERGQGFMIEEKDGPVRALTLTRNLVRAYTHVIVIQGENLAITDNVLIGDLSLPQAAQGSIELFNSRSATVQDNRFYNVRNPLYTEGVSAESLTAGNNTVIHGDPPPVEGVPTEREPEPEPPASSGDAGDVCRSVACAARHVRPAGPVHGHPWLLPR